MANKPRINRTEVLSANRGHSQPASQTETLPQRRAPSVGAVPRTVAALGESAGKRYTIFFTDTIRNRNTREAYFRNAWRFFSYCESLGLEIDQIESFHVSAYVELLMSHYAKPTVKQNLATIRRLFDWLIIGQVLDSNPAHAVRGPKHVVNEGLTPILDHDDLQQLLQSIDGDTVVGKRDRALIATMTATFGRVSAVLGMDVDDYYQDGKVWAIRLYEKNGKVVTMPAQSDLETLLDDYISAVGGSSAFPVEDGERHGAKRPLFLTAAGRTGSLTTRRMSRQDAWRMIKRRASKAGVSTRICNHSLRGTGITNYRENGGSLENAAYMAGHSSTSTTKLYDRRKANIKRKEVEKITILSPDPAPRSSDP